MMRLFSPVPDADASQHFGLSRHDITGKLSFIKGMIYDGSITVACCQDGIVEKVGFSKKFGNYILIKHETKLYTFYAYGEKAPNFKKGQRIGAQEFLFDSAKIGNAKRPQFYFEVRTKKNGGQVDPFAHFFPFKVYPGVLPPEQKSLKVNGKMNKETWAAWQESLKYDRTWSYYGLIDGKPGELTWKAIRQSVEGLVDESSPEPEQTLIIKAVQIRLQDLGFYDGEPTGRLDKETVSALQRTFNAGKYK